MLVLKVIGKLALCVNVVTQSVSQTVCASHNAVTTQDHIKHKKQCLLAASGALKIAPGRYPTIPSQSHPNVALSVQNH